MTIMKVTGYRHLLPVNRHLRLFPMQQTKRMRRLLRQNSVGKKARPNRQGFGKKANDLKKLEDKIEQFENRLSEIDEAFMIPENATNAVRLNELSIERKSVEKRTGFHV